MLNLSALVTRTKRLVWKTKSQLLRDHCCAGGIPGIQHEDVDEQIIEREQSVKADEIVEEDTTYV